MNLMSRKFQIEVKRLPPHKQMQGQDMFLEIFGSTGWYMRGTKVILTNSNSSTAYNQEPSWFFMYQTITIYTQVVAIHTPKRQTCTFMFIMPYTTVQP